MLGNSAFDVEMTIENLYEHKTLLIKSHLKCLKHSERKFYSEINILIKSIWKEEELLEERERSYIVSNNYKGYKVF